MTTPSPTAKPMPLTAQATLAHYTAQARIAELEVEVARLKVDAERYQWLRDRHVDAGFVEAKGVKCWPEGSKAYSRLSGFGAELDKQIDAALAASKEN